MKPLIGGQQYDGILFERLAVSIVPILQVWIVILITGDCTQVENRILLLTLRLFGLPCPQQLHIEQSQQVSHRLKVDRPLMKPRLPLFPEQGEGQRPSVTEEKPGQMQKPVGRIGTEQGSKLLNCPAVLLNIVLQAGKTRRGEGGNYFRSSFLLLGQFLPVG